MPDASIAGALHRRVALVHQREHHEVGIQRDDGLDRDVAIARADLGDGVNGREFGAVGGKGWRVQRLVAAPADHFRDRILMQQPKHRHVTPFAQHDPGGGGVQHHLAAQNVGGADLGQHRRG